MSHYKPYPAYKDSGVEWIGKVPEHWKIRPVKHLFRARLGKMIQPQPKTEEDVLVPYHRAQTVQWERVEHNQVESMWAHPSEIDSYSLEDGDLLICEGGDVCRAAVFNRDKHGTVIFQNSIHRVRPVDGNQPEWLLRMMQHVRSSEWIDVLCNKNTIVHFTSDKLASLEIPHPPPSEQVAILGALRREIARIDALIAKKTEFIKLLAKKRQALITHAVTKGLNPKARMKDSGVEWIGEVPEHWMAAPIKYVGRLESGHTPSRSVPAYWENCTVPWFTLADIWQVRKFGRKIITETSEMVSELGLANSSARKLPNGTVVLSRTASVGFPAILGCEMATSQDFAAWICGKRLHNEFLYFSLIAMKGELNRLMMGSTHKTIYMPDIEQFRCPLPPIGEQCQIAAYIQNQIDRFKQLTDKTQLSIDLLKKRRSTLITAAVTGQIDLRESA